MAHGRLADSRSLRRAGDAAFFEEDIEGEQQVQVDTTNIHGTNGDMKNIDWIDVSGRLYPVFMTSRSLRRRMEAGLFDGTLQVVARMARSPLRGLVAPLLASTAWMVRAYRRADRKALKGEALGQEWQRLMPNPRVMPITHVEGDTAYGEIHVHCPLRGSGDVHACHRLMEYDRALMRPAGARFVVLESQAEPGVTRCRVAMRPAPQPAEDLVPAHVRVEALVRR